MRHTPHIPFPPRRYIHYTYHRYRDTSHAAAMDPSVSLYERRAVALANRKGLQQELNGGGTNISRLSKTNKVKSIRMCLNERENGLEFTPQAKRAEQSVLLFTDVTAVRKLPLKSTVHKRGNLKALQQCLEVQSRRHVTWHLVLETQMDIDTWHAVFLHYMARSRDSRLRDPLTALIEAKWSTAKKERFETATFREASEILRSNFGGIPEDILWQRFNTFDRDKNVLLDSEEFVELFRSFCQYPNLRPIFNRLVEDHETGMTRPEFTQFLKSQGDLGQHSTSTSGTYQASGSHYGSSPPGANSSMSSYATPQQQDASSSTCSASNSFAGSASSVSSTYANALFDSFGLAPDGHLSFESFVGFLVSSRFNSAVDPRHRRCADPMHYPLNQYFINSSHNTYLCGNQWNSASSTVRYRDDLLAGCRCVEIDCWDGPGGDPVVYHGHTATSKIRFEDVVRTIEKYAFMAPTGADWRGNIHSDSESPGKASWNPREYPVILSLEVHTCEAQSNAMARMLRKILGEKLLLPGELRTEAFTPEKLRRKILVKWKASEHGDEDLKETTDSGPSPDLRSTEEVSDPRKSSELSACATIGSCKTKAWGQDAISTNVQSYTESAIVEFRKSFPRQFVVQNTRMLSRVYPAGYRLGSSNYDPMLSWQVGAHMVALNLQTHDPYTALNAGFFAAQNGGCGYVLKPLHLRDPAPTAGTSVAETSEPFTLNLNIVMGAHLGEAHHGDVDTSRFVCAWLHGREAQQRATSRVAGRSFDPTWNETLQLRGEHHGLDVLCLRIYATSSPGGDAAVIGQAMLPVRVLRGGCRAIPLSHPRTGDLFDFATIVCDLSIVA